MAKQETFEKIREFATFKVNIYIVGGFVIAKLCDINIETIETNDNCKIAAFKLNGISFDCGGLKSKEDYDSVRLKDLVLRRDFSVNAVYYNILTREIFDLIGGINNLRCDILRTCHDNSFNRFIKDVLRISRAIRFDFGKFGFKLDDKTKIINACNTIKCIKLTNGILHETLSNQLLKTLNGYNLLTSLKFTVDFNMVPVLFGTDSKSLKSLCTLIGIKGNIVAKEFFASCLTNCQNMHSLLLSKQVRIRQDNNDDQIEAEDDPIMKNNNKSEEISRENYLILVLVAFLFPLLTRINTIKHKQMNKSQNAIISCFIMQSIPGLSNKFAQKIEMYLDSSRVILSIMRCSHHSNINDNDNDKKVMRLNCGMLLLKMKDLIKQYNIVDKKLLTILNKEIKQLQLMYQKHLAQKMVVQKWMQQCNIVNKTATSCA